MKKIFVGFYLKPHVWIGKREEHKNPTELAFSEKDFMENIDLGIQRQGLVIASIETKHIPGYQESNVGNVLRSEIASYVLNLFNAFSFALYEAQLQKHQGGFQSIPQEVLLDDLYLWQGNNYQSIEIANANQPMPITTGEFSTSNEMVLKGKKTIGMLEEDDLKFRFEIDEEVFISHINKKLLSASLRKLFAVINRGVVSIRGASFDMALINFWTVIELLLKDIWSDFLTQKKLPKKRMEFLSGKDLTAAIISENLNLHGLINDSLYNDISDARRTRNKLMHELQVVEPRICYKAYDAIKQLVSKQYSIDIIHGGSFYFGDIKFSNE